MAIKSSKNSILLINQTLSELKLNINYLLEESFKYTMQNLFIYCLNPFISSSSSGNISRIFSRHIVDGEGQTTFSENTNIVIINSFFHR